MSSLFSAKSGSLERLMRLPVTGIPDTLRTERTLTPRAFAMARPSPMRDLSRRRLGRALRACLVAQQGFDAASAYHTCQRHTAGRLTPAWCATSATANPSPDSNTIWPRWMSVCGRFRSITIKAVASDRIVNDDANCLGYPSQFARTARPCEASVCVSALASAFPPKHGRHSKGEDLNVLD
jgi:hypothetical protein